MAMMKIPRCMTAYRLIPKAIMRAGIMILNATITYCPPTLMNHAAAFVQAELPVEEPIRPNADEKPMLAAL